MTPLRRGRDTLLFLRSALGDEKVTETYETFSVSGFRLENAVDPPPPIAVAALRPEMLRLAAKKADGAITNWLGPGDVRQIREVVGQSVELVGRIFVCPTTDRALAHRLGRRLIAEYLTVPALPRSRTGLAAERRSSRCTTPGTVATGARRSR